MPSGSVIEAHALSRVPSRAGMTLFAAKAFLLRWRRRIVEIVGEERVKRWQKGDSLGAAPVVSRSISPLWNSLGGAKDYALTAGKIHNLRLATALIDGVEVMPGGIFSFWKQIGPATRLRGFVTGRELREGCLIGNVGGGLCQLSNGLYEAALDAGLEITERHAHSRIVPGSRAARGRDATVFWNYVDLRFRSKAAFRIEAALHHGRLDIAIRSGSKADGTGAPEPETNRGDANDCTSCNQRDCHLNDSDSSTMGSGDHPTAWLVDACWPEFASLYRDKVRKQDALLMPQRLRDTARHAWPRALARSESRATFVALRRAFSLRRAPKQGRVLQTLLMRYDAALARSYARRLSHLHTHLVISQNLLPHLWRLGVLAGRSFDVLMERVPIGELQAMLDEAAVRYPESPTLADFRAPAEIAEAEMAALAEARLLYTPHRGIAKSMPGKTVLLDWTLPADAGRRTPNGKVILFPASALGRKGAYALRQALTGLDVELVVTGRAREQGGDFWGDIKLREASAWPSEIAAVVLPAIIEHQPRALLRALAMGIPVIATEACGLGKIAGVTLVPAFDAAALRHAIEAHLYISG